MDLDAMVGTGGGGGGSFGFPEAAVPEPEVDPNDPAGKMYPEGTLYDLDGKGKTITPNYAGKVLVRPDFRKATIDGANFSNCRLINASFQNVTWLGKTNFQGAKLEGTTEGSSKDGWCNFSNGVVKGELNFNGTTWTCGRAFFHNIKIEKTAKFILIKSHIACSFAFHMHGQSAAAEFNFRDNMIAAEGKEFWFGLKPLKFLAGSGKVVLTNTVFAAQSTNFVNVTFEEGVTVDFSRSRFTGPSASMAGTRFLTTKANLTQCDFGTCSFTACDLSKVKLGFETLLDKSQCLEQAILFDPDGTDHGFGVHPLRAAGLIVTIGPSKGSHTKTVTVPWLTGDYICPTEVNRNNWLGGHTFPDTFNISVAGDQVTATRTDSNSAWGLNLQFMCRGHVKDITDGYEAAGSKLGIYRLSLHISVVAGGPDSLCWLSCAW